MNELLSIECMNKLLSSEYMDELLSNECMITQWMCEWIIFQEHALSRSVKHKLT